MGRMARELLWFDDVRYVKASNFGQEIVNILKQANLTQGRVGYVGRDVTPMSIWKYLEDGLGEVKWIDFSNFLDERRVVKDEVQLVFHRRAAEICDALFGTLGHEIRNGKKSAYQLQGDMEHRARYEGCEYCSPWLTVAPVADYPRYYKEECLRVPQLGDQVLVGIYLIYEGHWGHAVRTGVLGMPKDVHRKAFDVALEMQEAALSRLRPGEDLILLEKNRSGSFVKIIRRPICETPSVSDWLMV